MRLTVINSIKPKILTKQYFLNSGRELDYTTAAQMVEGSAKVVTCNSISEFGQLLENLQHNQALCYGVPEQSPVNILSRKEFERQGRPTNTITRTNDCFFWPDGEGMLFIDYDPAKGSQPLSRDELIQTLSDVIPCLDGLAYVWWGSSSSCIYSGDEQLKGVNGQRLYLHVKEAGDISRAGKVLAERLWLAGLGYIEVNAAGRMLERCLIDTTVWQPSRLDFASGSKCKPPLEQRRGKPVCHEGRPLHTKEALPDLLPEEQREVLKLKQAAKEAMRPEAENAEHLYIEEKALEMAQGDEIKLDAARATLRRALEHDILTGDFPVIMEDGTTLTVGEILDDPYKYHLKLTRDPIEPEYCGNKVVGKLYLIGSRPNLHSFAHGGKNYRMVRQPRRIEIVRGRTHDAVLQTLALLREIPDVFDYGESMVTIESGKLVTFNDALLQHWLGGVIQYWGWRKVGNNMVEVLDDPSARISKPLLSMPRQLKPLNAIITAPVVAGDGRVVSAPGYDAGSEMFLDLEDNREAIPFNPSMEQVKAAAETLWQPFTSFPFATVLDKSVLMAALLSAVQRPVLRTCPAFGFDAPVQGSGKSLLAETIAVLASGDAPKIWPHTAGHDDEETRKRLTTALKSGERVLIWDNVLGVFDSAAMAALLTSATYTDRILGQSQEVTIPNKVLILLTGNNLCLAGDMPRRVLLSRIDPQTEEPHKRRFALCPRSYTLANRQKMVAAALTIIRGWLCSDEHKSGISADGRMASFEQWDDLIRQPIAWLGRSVMPDQFVDVMQAVDDAQQNDPEQEALYELLSAIRDLFGRSYFTAKDLLDDCNSFSKKHERVQEALAEVAPGKNSRSARSVGRILMYRVDRIVRGLRLRRISGSNDRHVYQVENLGSNVDTCRLQKQESMDDERLAMAASEHW